MVVWGVSQPVTESLCHMVSGPWEMPNIRGPVILVCLGELGFQDMRINFETTESQVDWEEPIILTQHHQRIFLTDSFCVDPRAGCRRGTRGNIYWVEHPRASSISSLIPFSSVHSAPVTQHPLLPWTSLFPKQGLTFAVISAQCLQGLTWQPLVSYEVSAQMPPLWGGSPRLDNWPLSYKTRLCSLNACINLGDFLAQLRMFCLPPSAARGTPENKTLLSSMALFPALFWHIVSLYQNGLNEWPATCLPDVSTLFSSANHCGVGSEKCPHINSFHGTLIFFRRGAFSGSGPFTT